MLRMLRGFCVVAAFACLGAAQTTFTGPISGSGSLDCGDGVSSPWSGSGTLTLSVTPSLPSLLPNGGTFTGTWSINGSASGCDITVPVNPTGTATGSVTSSGSLQVLFTGTCAFTGSGTIASITGQTPTTCIDPSFGSASGIFSFTITSGLGPPVNITTTSLPRGNVNTPYTATVSATGGKPPYTWSATGLPAGLSINSTTGAITGTPTSIATASVTITVSDSSTPTKLTAKATLTLVISPGIGISTTSLPAGVVNTPYSATLAASGGTPPYSWSGSNLPPGLILGATTGVITGTPTQIGNFPVSVTATDNSNPRLSASVTLTLVISGGLTISTTALPGGTQNAPYSATLAVTGGVAPYSWSTTSALPGGLSLNGTSGVLSGTPTTAGTFTLAIAVTDNSSPRLSTSKTLTLAIAAAFPSVSVKGGEGSNVAPTATNTFTVTLPSAALTPSTGTLSLRFASDAVNQVSSDPEVTFVSGTTPVTTVGFSFATGQTTATLTPANAAVQAGTVAGTISTVISTYQGSAPPNPIIGTMVVPRTAPAITGIKLANKTASGFDVCVTGYSSRRDITAASYQFTGSGTGTLSTTNLPAGADLIGKFTSWFQGTTSVTTGGQFLLDQTFTVNGPDTAIGSITVTLANDAGSVTSASVPYSGFAASCN